MAQLLLAASARQLCNAESAHTTADRAVVALVGFVLWEGCNWGQDCSKHLQHVTLIWHDAVTHSSAVLGIL